MQSAAHRFYQFSGAHALLIGLLPFFLPALMWQQGISLAEISVFIGFAGIGYVATLAIWDNLRARTGYRPLLIGSFLLEGIVVAAVVLDSTLTMHYAIAVLYGAYGCFYWMTQRLLFVESSQDNNTGRRFGNAQILVTVLLKLGILCGGLMWEHLGAVSVLVLTLVLSLPTAVLCATTTLPQLSQSPPVSARLTLRFRDAYRSRTVFLIDGVFLFAESYFWVISLYLIANENVARLGILVVGLSVMLSGVFFAIKNRLDHIEPQRVFAFAVVGYAMSWWMRGLIDVDSDSLWLYPVIVVIAFLTALFRLVLNKRFFDIARRDAPHRYIVIKSYWSQGVLGLAYVMTGFALQTQPADGSVLPVFYYALAPLALLYLVYRRPSVQAASDSDE